MQLGDLDQSSLVEDYLLDINLSEFFQVMQLLDEQKNLKEHYRQLPLIRERIEDRHVLNVSEFRDYLDKAKKIHYKLQQVYDFEEQYRHHQPNSNQDMLTQLNRFTSQTDVPQKDIVRLIDALKL